MEEIRLKAGNEELRVKGSSDTIRREREAFYQHQKEVEEANTKAKLEFVERTRAKLAIYAKSVDDGKVGIKRSCGKMEASWKEIQQAVKAGIEFQVGDYVTDTLKNGEKITMVITDATDEYVRFESKDCVGERHVWNENDSNEGGYFKSDIQNYLNTEIASLLPDEMLAVMSSTTRKWADKDGNEGEYECKLFLPAASEVFDEDECYGDKGLYEQLEYYKDCRNRMRSAADTDDTCYWWLASVRYGNSTNACLVNNRGYAFIWFASSAYRVPVCFLIKR